MDWLDKAINTLLGLMAVGVPLAYLIGKSAKDSKKDREKRPDKQND